MTINDIVKYCIREYPSGTMLNINRPGEASRKGVTLVNETNNSLNERFSKGM